MRRREFLSYAAGAVLSSTGLTSLAAAPRFRKPGEKLNIGVIGCGGRGWTDWTAMFAAGENIAALCDTDRGQMERAKAHMAKSRPFSGLCFSDWREMLSKCENLDAVVVATPDHTHAPAAIAAMKKGCHAYVEKPLVRTIWEARKFAEVAKAAGVVTQLGNQGSSDSGFRRNVEVLLGGVIGNGLEVHIWTDRPIWPQGIERPAGSDPVPATLNWDAWIGSAPMRPFKQGVYTPFKWRAFYDFGTGAFGDMACHTMNVACRGLRFGAVESAECIRIEGAAKDTYPKKSVVKLRYAPRFGMSATDLYWYEGNLKPDAKIMPQVIATLGEVPRSGCLIIGDEGTMIVTHDNGLTAYFAKKGEEKLNSVQKHPAAQAVAQSLPRLETKHKDAWRWSAHQIEFVKACKGECKAFSDTDHSVPMMEGMLVGCIAQRVPGKLVWNAAACRFDGNSEADRYIRPVQRDGWKID